MKYVYFATLYTSNIAFIATSAEFLVWDGKMQNPPPLRLLNVEEHNVIWILCYIFEQVLGFSDDAGFQKGGQCH